MYHGLIGCISLLIGANIDIIPILVGKYDVGLEGAW